MKNHERVNGCLLQTNKKWGALKQKQKEWITQVAREEYERFLVERHKLPVRGSKKQFIEKVYERIEEKEIWIPYGEVYMKLCALIARWNRKQQVQEEPLGEPGAINQDASSGEG